MSTESTESTTQNQTPNSEASLINAIKDQAVGAIKEVIGNVIGNPQMQLEGKAQKVHGLNEYEFAKAGSAGETEPQKFQDAYHSSETQSSAPLPSVETEPSQASGLKDQALGSVKESIGSATNNMKMELEGKAQNIHGKNEAEFAKANKEGLNEPEHFEHGGKRSESAQGTVEGDSVSSLSAVKDRAIGSIKETIGSATGNINTEIAGKAQQLHGKNEAEFAKAQREGKSEPEHYAHGTKTTEHAQGEVDNQDPSTLGALKDKALGSVKGLVGSVTGNQDMELKGIAQNIHGKNQAEFVKAQKQGLTEPEHFAHGTKSTEHAEHATGEVDTQEPSTLTGLKDQAIGAVKGAIGSATNNQDLELKGKAQEVHGRNQTEFAKAQKEGLTEPEKFGQKTEQAEGQVEGDNVSSLSAIKDRAIGSIKETIGSATGDMNTELAGKAQNIHGRNEAEFVKAQKEGLTEPEHYAHGTKTTEHAQGEVVTQEPSKLSAAKDQAVGAVKQTIGSATNNQKLEIEGKAQQIQGSLASKADETH